MVEAIGIEPMILADYSVYSQATAIRLNFRKVVRYKRIELLRAHWKCAMLSVKHQYRVNSFTNCTLLQLLGFTAHGKSCDLHFLVKMVEKTGIEPVAYALQVRRSAN